MERPSHDERLALVIEALRMEQSRVSLAVKISKAWGSDWDGNDESNAILRRLQAVLHARSNLLESEGNMDLAVDQAIAYAGSLNTEGVNHAIRSLFEVQ